MKYAPTASQKGATAYAIAPSAMAAMAPTPTEEKNNFREDGNFTNKSLAAIGETRDEPWFNFTVLGHAVDADLWQGSVW